MLFKKKQKEGKKTGLSLPQVPTDTTMQQIKSSVEKDLSTLPELPSMPEFAPLFKPIKEEIIPTQLETEIKTEEFKFPEEERGKKMTMDVGEHAASFEPLSFRGEMQPSLQPIQLKTEERSVRESERIFSQLDKPIYVKIARFKYALNTFELVKKKIREIDMLLKKIKETREKEQQELAAWEQEISDIKEKINAVDSKLFSKLD